MHRHSEAIVGTIIVLLLAGIALGGYLVAVSCAMALVMIGSFLFFWFFYVKKLRLEWFLTTIPMMIILDGLATVGMWYVTPNGFTSKFASACFGIFVTSFLARQHKVVRGQAKPIKEAAREAAREVYKSWRSF